MEYDLNSISAVLFMLHVIASGFMLSVIRKQLGLFKKYINPELKRFRLILFLLSMAIFIGNLIPLTIDLITAIEEPTREIPFARIVYISSTAIISVISAGLIWSMYRQAAKTAVIVEEDKIEALQKKK